MPETVRLVRAAAARDRGCLAARLGVRGFSHGAPQLTSRRCRRRRRRHRHRRVLSSPADTNPWAGVTTTCTSGGLGVWNVVREGSDGTEPEQARTTRTTQPRAEQHGTRLERPAPTPARGRPPTGVGSADAPAQDVLRRREAQDRGTCLLMLHALVSAPERARSSCPVLTRARPAATQPAMPLRVGDVIKSVAAAAPLEPVADLGGLLTEAADSVRSSRVRQRAPAGLGRGG